MRPLERPLSCSRARVLLDAYIDGDLSPVRTSSVENHLAGCSACRDEVQAAQRVRTALRQMPPREMPVRELPARESTARGLFAGELPAPAAAAPGPAAQPQASRSPVTALRQPGHRPQWWRPLAVAALLAGVVLGAVRVFDRPTETPVTTADVARAELQVRWVMARLGEINRRTSARVREDVIEKSVVGPSARAVETAFDQSMTQ